MSAFDPKIPQLKTDATESADDDRFVWRDRFIAIFGGVACIASLLAVQKSIEHKRLLDAENYHVAVDIFDRAVSHGASFAAAASAAGFQYGHYLRIEIETLRRNANGQVEMRGWAADMPGDGTPLVLFLLAGNTTVFQAQTNGGREDVARAFMLTDVAARNVRFDGTFSCKAKEPLRLVLTTSSMTYLSHYPIICP